MKSSSSLVDKARLAKAWAQSKSNEARSAMGKSNASAIEAAKKGRGDRLEKNLTYSTNFRLKIEGARKFEDLANKVVNHIQGAGASSSTVPDDVQEAIDIVAAIGKLVDSNVLKPFSEKVQKKCKISNKKPNVPHEVMVLLGLESINAEDISGTCFALSRKNNVDISLFISGMSHRKDVSEVLTRNAKLVDRMHGFSSPYKQSEPPEVVNPYEGLIPSGEIKYPPPGVGYPQLNQHQE